ncbi:protein jag [Lachnospiraceae bacterium KGMB03038]|nr:protein jag [Lachnospiraceae bacterium KGMB03038]
MDEYITVSAKTLDDAITDALVELGVTSDQLDYIVVEKGSAGFLGIGMKQAVIKARKKQVVPEPEKEKVQPEEQPEKKKESNRPEKRKQKKTSHHKEHREPETEEKKEKAEKPAEKEKEIELAPVEEITIETCRKFVQDVLEAMHMEDVEVTAKVDEEGALCINMDGKNMGILIGKRGQTLDSLQYLTNRVANKMQSGYVRVKLDTEDYRRRRKETLENLAKNIASKVKRTRRTVALEPMNPYERRIIHSALQSDPAVSTHSEGEEPYRRVVVTLVRR